MIHTAGAPGGGGGDDGDEEIIIPLGSETVIPMGGSETMIPLGGGGGGFSLPLDPSMFAGPGQVGLCCLAVQLSLHARSRTAS